MDTNIIVFTAGKTLGWLLLILWIWKCIVRIDEGWHKNTKVWGIYGRTFSGVKGLVADKTGKLVPGKIFPLFRYFRFILWPIEYVPFYKFRWMEAKSISEIPENKSKFIMWRNNLIDAIVTFLRIEKTNRHKHQHSYRFAFTDLETGEKRSADENVDGAENIHLDINASTLVIMVNPAQAQFTDGGDADWYTELESSLKGIFNEVIRNTIFADLRDICGTNIGNVPVSNVEPLARAPKTNGDEDKGYVPLFRDQQGNQRLIITFLERVNYEMLIDKKMGVYIKSPSILEFKVSEESQKFVSAVQDRSISAVNLQTAKNNAQALNESLRVKKDFIVKMAAANVKATRAIKQTPDATIIGKAKEMRQAPQLRVYVEGETTSSQNTGGIDVNKLIETTLALELAGEIKEEGSDNQQNQKKGGNNRGNKN